MFLNYRKSALKFESENRWTTTNDGRVISAKMDIFVMVLQIRIVRGGRGLILESVPSENIVDICNLTSNQ